MKTALIKRTESAIRAWAGDGVKAVRHIHPRAYVIGYAAPKCLIVAVPWPDAEDDEDKKWERENGLKIVRTFDKSLRAGDWCSTAYVQWDGRAEPVAIPVVE